MTVQFMCPACGGASIAVPATCAEEAEIASGAVEMFSALGESSKSALGA